MRRATLHLVLGVALLDAIAKTTYYAAIVHAPERTKMVLREYGQCRRRWWSWYYCSECGGDSTESA